MQDLGPQSADQLRAAQVLILLRAELARPGGANPKVLAGLIAELQALGGGDMLAALRGQQLDADLTALARRIVQWQAAFHHETAELDVLTALPDVLAPDQAELDALDAAITELRGRFGGTIRDFETALAEQGEAKKREDKARYDRERDATVVELRDTVDRERTPLAEAGPMADRILTQFRRYVYEHVPIPWIGASLPGIVTAFNASQKQATVRLLDGSGGVVDGVDTGEGSPAVDAPTVVHFPVQAPLDPRDPRMWPLPGGRAFLIAPPGGKFIYYAFGLNLFKLPWPLTNAEAEPELVRHLFADNPVTQEFWAHQEQHLGFDGMGTWWVALTWQDNAPEPFTYHHWLIGYDNLAKGDVHAHFYGTRGPTTETGMRPEIWATDPTPGHTGFIGVWVSGGVDGVVGGFDPNSEQTFHDDHSTFYQQIALSASVDAPYTLGPKIKMREGSTRHYHSGQISDLGDTKEYWRQNFDHHAYWLWHDGNTQRARWSITARRDAGQPWSAFYNESTILAELTNQYFEHVWAGNPSGESGLVKEFVNDDTSSFAQVFTRRDTDGSLHPLADLPANVHYPAGQDRTLTDLLVLDRQGVYWASEDSGDTWYVCPKQIGVLSHFEGGKWAYIIDESEYGGS